MKPFVQKLDWDSAYWGISVGRIWIDSQTDVSTFQSLLRRAQHEFEFVQALIPADGIAHVQAAEDAGFRLVDIRCVLTVSPQNFQLGDAALSSVEPCLSEDLDDAAELAARCHTISRFACDPMLEPERRAELYRRWLLRDAGRPGWQVCVVRDAANIFGYVTFGVETPGGVGSIGLIGVSDHSRRSGIGKALAAYATVTSFKQGTEQMTVVTQAGNSAAMHVYRGIGFVPIEMGCWMHWHRSPAVNH